MAVRFGSGDRCGGHLVVRLRQVTESAEIYEALDGRDGHRRILKVVVGARATAKAEARLAVECQAIATIEHAHVVRFYDAGVHRGKFWLLRELVEGTTLRERMFTSLSIEQILRWTRQACDGVAEAHRKRILHRDLKPDNIIITNDDIAKVADFGLAKFVDFDLGTSHGPLIGTPAYMAPEHIRGQKSDGRMDVYSMCMILYEALSRTNPMGGPNSTIVEACSRQVQYVPPPLASFVPGVSGDLSDLVQAGLQKEPERRTRTMRELSAALQEELERVLAPRRRAARNAAPSEDPRTARTGAMAAVPSEDADQEPAAPLSEPTAIPSARASVPSSSQAETQRSPSTLEHGISLDPATVSTPDLVRPPDLVRRPVDHRRTAGVGLLVVASVISAATYFRVKGGAPAPTTAAASASVSASVAAEPSAPAPVHVAPASLPSVVASNSASTTPAASPSVAASSSAGTTSATPAASTKVVLRRAIQAPDPWKPPPPPVPTARHRIFGVEE